MELFAAGVLTTLAILAILKLYIKLRAKKNKVFRQTIVYEFMKLMVRSGLEIQQPETQSRIFADSKPIRFIKADDEKVYWIYDGNFLWADLVDDQFDPAKGQPVNIKNLPKEEVNRLLLILDALQNG